MTEKDPNGMDPNKPGAKLDAGKSPVRRGLLEYFPRACMAVADISAAGASKYTWGGWETVAGGIDRYGDAEVRHICKAAIEGPVDPDFGLLHAAHEAWGAMARLELILREQSKSSVAEESAKTTGVWQEFGGNMRISDGCNTVGGHKWELRIRPANASDPFGQTPAEQCVYCRQVRPIARAL